jgi:hypothetical protein
MDRSGEWGKRHFHGQYSWKTWVNPARAGAGPIIIKLFDGFEEIF